MRKPDPLCTPESIAAAKRAQVVERAAVEMACGVRICDDGSVIVKKGASGEHADPDQALKGAPSHEHRF